MRAVLVLLVLLVACGVAINDGVVVEKYTTPAFSSLMPAGKAIIPIHHPKKWWIVIRKDTLDRQIERRIQVSAREWDKIHVGQYLNVSDLGKEW